MKWAGNTAEIYRAKKDIQKKLAAPSACDMLKSMHIKKLILGILLVCFSAAVSFSCDESHGPPLQGVLFQGGVQ